MSDAECGSYFGGCDLPGRPIGPVVKYCFLKTPWTHMHIKECLTSVHHIVQKHAKTDVCNFAYTHVFRQNMHVYPAQAAQPDTFEMALQYKDRIYIFLDLKHPPTERSTWLFSFVYMDWLGLFFCKNINENLVPTSSVSLRKTFLLTYCIFRLHLTPLLVARRTNSTTVAWAKCLTAQQFKMY